MKGVNIKEYFVKYNSPRRIVQLLSFIFFSAVFFTLVQPLLLPVMWTWGLNQNVVGDAFTALQLCLAGWQSTQAIFPWLTLASFLLIGVIVGKSLCGWVCPFGFVQDLIGFVKHKKNEFSLRTHESMVYVKYGVLGLTLFISTMYSVSKIAGYARNYERALSIFATAPFTTLSPAETLFGTFPRMASQFGSFAAGKSFLEIISGISSIPYLFWPQFIIFVGVIALALFIPRSWCRYFCPHGAIMAVLNNFSFIGLRRDPVKCAKGGCRQCVGVCPMRVPILDLPWEKFSHPECIYCMKCADACKDKAIRIKYP